MQSALFKHKDSACVRDVRDDSGGCGLEVVPRSTVVEHVE